MCICSSHLLLVSVSVFALLSFASEAAPTYSAHACTDGSYYRPNTTFKTNLNLLLSSLVSKATLHDGFYRTNISLGTPDEVKGLFLCRGDVTPSVCQDCVAAAAKNITYLCTNQTESIIWYDECMLRYSNSSTLNNIVPGLILMTVQIIPDSDPQLEDFLASTVEEAAREAVNSLSGKKFATTDILTSTMKLYILAQCMPDLSTSDCNTCFSSAISTLGDRKQGARVLLPGCNVRYDLYPFYNVSAVSTQTKFFSPSSENNEGRSRVVILVVVLVVVSAMLLSLCCYLRRRKVRKNNYATLLRKIFGRESITLEGLQFDLTIIKAATNNFSSENKIGQGGFGEVYKGILYDGRHVAAKKLSINSKQGSIEFKNEILLIAKLQHRNLVTFIGFCLEEHEKILIYEYMPNGSLDYLLFGTRQQKLSWPERYKIIGGIALGLLYLHEYSRLKVIHRDLKPSNVLLDTNMNPKISDFGMAKIIEIDQDCGNTNRIAGTHGYMSPEYAMFGQFSEKSDVFSFGVMILEIISGKRNVNSYESHNVVEGLMGYVWRQWKFKKSLSIMDSYIEESYSHMEVMKCIHIGLLCVQENPNIRPTMAMIVSYLNNHLLELPSPQEPAFFLCRRRMDQDLINQQESSSNQVTNGSTLLSINEMSVSSFYPR